MHPKMEIDYTGYGKGTIGLLHSLLLKQSTLSDRKIIQKLYSMSLYDIRDYTNNTIYETFDNTITRYKRNSVYDNTLLHRQNKCKEKSLYLNSKLSPWKSI